MTATATTASRERLVTIGRWTAAVAFASIFGAAVWLAIMEEGHGGHILGHTWTDHTFPDGLGNALGAADNVARRGMWGTLLIAPFVVLLFLAVERFLPLRSWRKGLAFAPAIFVLWGLVFCPLVDARQYLTPDAEFGYLPSGLFGTDSSRGTIASAIVASIVTALTIARITQLVRSRAWWEPARGGQDFIVDRGSGSLLEFPEQRSDQGGERTG